MLDIDRFKEINDTLGHALGDLVLLEVAHRLRDLGDPVELVSRLGADEFAIVASSDGEHASTEAMAARVLAAVSEAIDVGGVRLRLRASVGVAEAAVDENGASLGVPALLRRAEVAMYLAKAEHRGIRHYSDDLERSSVSRLALASDLADALENGRVPPRLPAQDRRADQARDGCGGPRAVAPPDPRACSSQTPSSPSPSRRE